MAEISSNGPRLSGFWYGDVPGELVYATNFSDPPGLSGFTPLMNGTSPKPGISLVCFPALYGSHAMMMTTGPVGAATKDGVCQAVLRLSRLFDSGRTFGWDVWVGLGSSDTTFAPQHFAIGFDTQNRAGAVRQLPLWRYDLLNPATGAALNLVTVVNDAGTYVNATDRVTGATLSAPYIYNQNKLNLIYFSGRWNLTTGYQSAQVFDQVVDLTGQSFGSGTTTLAGQFSSGFNLYMELSNRGSTHLNPGYAVIGAVRIWVE